MPNSSRLQMTLKLAGVKELDAVLRALPTKLFVVGMVTAVRAGGGLIVKAAKAKAPRESGLLKEAVGLVVRKYKRSGKVLAVLGPRKGFKGRQTKTSRKSAAMASLRAVRNPANYGHLQEFRHRIVRGGKLARLRQTRKKGKYSQPGTGKARVVGMSRPHPFLGPAFQQQKGPAQEQMRTKLRTWIESQRAKGKITV